MESLGYDKTASWYVEAQGGFCSSFSFFQLKTFRSDGHRARSFELTVWYAMCNLLDVTVYINDCKSHLMQ